MTAKAEIHYIVPDASENQADVETILASIGAYQNELPFHVLTEAEISEYGDSTMLKLQKTIKDVSNRAAIQEAAERMRRAVEGHFPEQDRARLSARFAGIAIQGAGLYKE